MTANTTTHGERRERLGLMLLMGLHIAACCASLAYIPQLHDDFHVFFNLPGLQVAVLTVASFSLVSIVFMLANFSFGYMVGFYCYTLVLGYLWLSCFSDFKYDHRVSGLSAAVSAVAFLLPALFILTPVKRFYTMSAPTFERMLLFMFLFSLATIAISASYNFRFAGPMEVSNLRSDSFPAPVKYLIGMTSTALLPFLFALLVTRGEFLRAGAILLALLCFYPIAMNKVAFFAPPWLAAMALGSAIFSTRKVVILSLLAPTIAGVILFFVFQKGAIPYDIAIPYFETINYRMMAIPSIALDVYNDFFSRHDLTYFCQMRPVKPFVDCPYQDPLSIVMANTYPSGGNMNASLFATEGVASVGVLFAPLSAFGCGLIIALGNRLSAGLPPRFILMSSAMLAQILLNVPLSTALLTHGAGLLFLLWYLTPRSMFGEVAAGPSNSSAGKGG